MTKDGTSYQQMDNVRLWMYPSVCAERIVKAVKHDRREILVGGKELPWSHQRFVPALTIGGPKSKIEHGKTYQNN
jgi:hypothetical protein